jgi:tetratricopeptide (TPR) repeat protein
MTILNGDSRAHDELLDEVVVAYLEAVENGDAPDSEEWQARYPELASDLADFFADHDKVKRLTAPLRKAASSLPLPIEDPDTTVEYRPCPLLPTRIGNSGDYLLLEEIARGGMGVVYLARQISLDRMVAVKMIISGYMASQAEIQRFHAEALAAAHLDHPNIVPIYEVGEFEGQPFYSMKVMEGGSLSEHLSDMRERPKEAVGLMVKVAQAVHHAHQRGILHRDLKPGNVLLDRAGEPYVSDFGLSKRIEDITHSGVVVGTPGYMAPEQAGSQERPTTAADVYSLGAVLYALLTGRPPFQAESRLEILKQLAEQVPRSPRMLNPRVDRDLETICLKCLEKSPVDRYSSVGSLAEDLQRYLAGEPIQARPSSLWVRVLKWIRRRPALAMLQVVILITILGIIVGYLRYQEHRAAVAEQSLLAIQRTDSLRREVQELMDRGRQAMSAGHWSDARIHLGSARGLLGREPALVDLQAPVDRLLEKTERELQHEVVRQQAVRKHQKFMDLRGDALFRGALFTETNPPANPKKVRRTVQEALQLFGVAADSGAGPVFEPSLTADERIEVNEGCYELLLILADTTATDGTEGVKQALRILERAKGLGLQSRAYHAQRARYLERLGDQHGSRKTRKQADALQAGGALDHFLLGEEYHRQGNVHAAIGAFHNALRIQPNHFWARYLLSVCYLRLQPSRPDLASDGLTACLREGRNVDWVHLLRGIAYTQLDLFGAAEDDFQKVLDHKPNEDALYAVLVNRGVLRGRQRDFVRATADLMQAIALKPNSYQARINLAKVYQQRNEIPAALDQMDRAIETATRPAEDARVDKPALANLYRNRAMLQLDRKDHQAALEDFSKAIQAYPRAEDYSECGRILRGLKRYQEALAAYDSALKANPACEDALLGRCETLCKLGNWTDACSSLDEFLKRCKQTATSSVLADVYRVRGLTEEKLGRHADAIADFTVSLSHKADSPTYAHRGWAYLVSKAPQLALLDFENAIQLDDKNGDAYNGRGAARIALAVKLNHVREAIADAETALSHGPASDPRLLWNAARIYAQAADRLDAEREFARSRISGEYRKQVLRLLREALKETPAAERASFVRKSIQADSILSPFAGVLNSK